MQSDILQEWDRAPLMCVLSHKTKHVFPGDFHCGQMVSLVIVHLVVDVEHADSNPVKVLLIDFNSGESNQDFMSTTFNNWKTQDTPLDYTEANNTFFRIEKSCSVDVGLLFQYEYEL